MDDQARGSVGHTFRVRLGRARPRCTLSPCPAVQLGLPLARRAIRGPELCGQAMTTIGHKPRITDAMPCCQAGGAWPTGSPSARPGREQARARGALGGLNCFFIARSFLPREACDSAKVSGIVPESGNSVLCHVRVREGSKQSRT